MKKMKLAALLLALCMVLSIPAMAAGKTETTKAKVTVVEGAGATAVFDETNEDIIDVTVTSNLLVENEQYVIMMIRSDDGDSYTITEDSILYIDQAAAKADGENGSVSFSVYPSTLASSVILISGAEDDLLKVAIVEGKYILGDVDENGKVDSMDAVYVLRWVVSLETDVFNEQAADADQNGKIDSFDAVKILRYVVFSEAIEKK